MEHLFCLLCKLDYLNYFSSAYDKQYDKLFNLNVLPMVQHISLLTHDNENCFQRTLMRG